MQWKLKLLIFTYFTTVGIIVPFLPLYFDSRGLTNSQIGILLALGPCVSILVQSPWGYLSDRLQTVKKLLLLQFTACLILSFLLFHLRSFSLLVPTVIGFYAFFLPSFPQLDCLILANSKKSGKHFGSYRLWGSLGFAVTALAAGELLAVVGIEWMKGLYQGLLLISILLIFLVKDVPPSGKTTTASQFKELLQRPEVLYVLIFIALVNTTNKANDAFMGILVRSIGGTEAEVGWAWTTGPLSEIPVFALFGLLLARYNETVLLALAAGAYALRWFLFAIAGDPQLIIVIQLLHGLSFGLFYMAGVSYMGKIVPPALRASGQGLLATFGGGLAGIAGSLLGGFIMDHFGPQLLYAASCGLVLLAVAAFNLLVIKHRAKTAASADRP
ncbi:MFS transporter, PPP family, 3-phenylpropionic acid transporter [Desulforamulus putei DSM 12395]|uniref:MFS transporter, PPP family, 3-phenylpropionic acid transporter n=1 Tax=Desulforamulus putei DSM 12395 TaxID=1121429 RepID=A0A1M4XZ79_9FIRM|nr:MFS transporter [Desulforamulus putei]SHE98914.1 MFS transporter, PPP family, 3-phenylpropionic acid transporter [Desulforamulus putei DSM 12395]